MVFTREINTEKTIKRVAVKIAYGWSIRGIRLYDTDLRFILDETWCTCSSRGDWIIYTIPDGQEIVGLTCNIFYG